MLVDSGLNLHSQAGHFSEEHKKSEPFSYREKVRIFMAWSEWRESNSRPLEPHCASLENTMYNPILPRLSIVKFQMRYTILFHWMSRRFIPFVVKRPRQMAFLPPAKLHRAISIFINRSCAFCLHELSIRRICQPCQ